MAQNKQQEQKKLEKDLKRILINLTTLKKYNVLKNPLENIYEYIAKGIKIRSRCPWYEDGEKSKKVIS